MLYVRIYRWHIGHICLSIHNISARTKQIVKPLEIHTINTGSLILIIVKRLLCQTITHARDGRRMPTEKRKVGSGLRAYLWQSDTDSLTATAGGSIRRLFDPSMPLPIQTVFNRMIFGFPYHPLWQLFISPILLRNVLTEHHGLHLMHAFALEV